MANTITVTLADLIKGSLRFLYRASERPASVRVGSNELADVSDTTFTLNASDVTLVEASDRLEYGRELIKIRSKSGSTFTAIRGHADTTAVAGITNGSELLLNPKWPRDQVASTIENGLRGALAVHLPLQKTVTVQRIVDKGWAELPIDVLEVFGVMYVTSGDNRLVDFDQWTFRHTVPTAVSTTGKALDIHVDVPDDLDLYLVYRANYDWATGVATPDSEADTIDLMVGTEDIIHLYVAAMLVTGREVTRVELDVIEEWNTDVATRSGTNLRFIRELWGEFYRRVDESMRLQPARKGITYRRRSKARGSFL